jgi:hypothetical protein
MMRRNAQGNPLDTTGTHDGRVIFHQISETSIRIRETHLTRMPLCAARFAINVREEDKGRIHFDEHAGAGYRRRSASANRGGAKQ